VREWSLTAESIADIRERDTDAFPDGFGTAPNSQAVWDRHVLLAAVECLLVALAERQRIISEARACKYAGMNRLAWRLWCGEQARTGKAIVEAQW
jgi:hypothetical protein